MKSLIKNSEMELHPLRILGRSVKIPYPLPFSFYFSKQDNQDTSIIDPFVRVMFDPDMLSLQYAGSLKLSGSNWTFDPGPKDVHVSANAILEMKRYFRKYMVLFLAVWDKSLEDIILNRYILGQTTFDEMLKSMDFYISFQDELKSIHDEDDLEIFCRDNKLINMHGNAKGSKYL